MRHLLGSAKMIGTAVVTFMVAVVAGVLLLMVVVELGLVPAPNGYENPGWFQELFNLLG